MIEKINSITCKEDFTEFIQKLATDFTNKKDEWENKTLPDYLVSISSYIDDCVNSPANNINWSNIDFKLLVRLLYIGKIY